MTLFEVLLVVFIVSVIILSGSFGWVALQTAFSLRSVGDEIRSQMQLGRELSRAGMNGADYQIRHTGNSVVLLSDGVEIRRYLLPSNVSLTPLLFNWSFSPITGDIVGCSLPCVIGVTMRGTSESIIIRANGIVD